MEDKIVQRMQQLLDEGFARQEKRLGKLLEQAGSQLESRLEESEERISDQIRQAKRVMLGEEPR